MENRAMSTENTAIPMVTQDTAMPITQVSADALSELLTTAAGEMMEIDGILNELDGVKEQKIKVKYKFFVWLGVCILALPIYLFRGHFEAVIEKLLDNFVLADESLTATSTGLGLFLVWVYFMYYISPLLIALVATYIYNSKARQKKQAELNQAISEAEQIAESRIAQCAKAILYIPPKYRYSIALQTMLDLMRAGRATDWTMCADKYEEQCHRWILEKNSREHIMLQQQTLAATKQAGRFAAAAAIFSGVDLIL
ncbi:MAG: hypothetical protein LBI54_02545 [Lachnospiraceae bacterium]|jgi:hypothetical protein|nr:hypothetical protein [Lachnospiraceae bacterium]